MARQTGISKRVFSYMKKNPGLVMSAQDIAEDLNENIDSVANATNRLVSLGLLKRHSKGMYYFDGPYHSEKPSVSVDIEQPPVAYSYSFEKDFKSVNEQRRNLIYEQIGITTHGTIIVLSEDGVMYALKDLDI